MIIAHVMKRSRKGNRPHFDLDVNGNCCEVLGEQSKRAALPEEPSSSASEPLVTCVLRYPDGRRAQRRFRVSDALQSLFDFSDAWV